MPGSKLLWAALVATALGLGAAPGPAAASDGAWDSFDAFPAEHLHGQGCGHFLYDGAWHLFPREHEHGPACGHYFIGPLSSEGAITGRDAKLANGRWDYFPSVHRHSIECGHFFWNGMWHLFAPGHVHDAGCGHFFYRGCWHLFPEGHVHGGGCGHVFADGEWRGAGQAGPRAGRRAEPEVAFADEPQVLEPRTPPAPPCPAPPEPEPRMREIVPLSAEEAAVYGRVIVVMPAPRTTFLYRVDSNWSPSLHGRYRRGSWDARPRVWTPSAYHIHGINCGHYYWAGRYHQAPCPPTEYIGRFRSRLPRRFGR